MTVRDISIVVCTHKRFNLVKDCVTSFMKQTTPKEKFEVIIVDNDLSPNKEVKELVEGASFKINIKYYFEDNLGLSNARNRGGKEASAAWIGYTDDDAKVKEDYIEVLLGLINHNDFDIIGGPYYPYYNIVKPKWFKESYESAIYGNSRLFTNKEFLNGTNMVFRKDILEKGNWFDPLFGMAGKKIAYAEETDLQIRLWKLYPGLKVFYCSDLVVYHLVPWGKMSVKDRLKRSYMMGKSQAYMWVDKDEAESNKIKASYQLIKTFLSLIITAIPRLIVRDMEKYPFWQNYVYENISDYFRLIGRQVRYILGG